MTHQSYESHIIGFYNISGLIYVVPLLYQGTHLLIFLGMRLAQSFWGN